MISAESRACSIDKAGDLSTEGHDDVVYASRLLEL